MSNPNDILKQVTDALGKAAIEVKKGKTQLEEDRKNLIASIGKDILGVLHPLLEKISENSKVNKEELKRAISEATINVDVQANTPIVNVPDVYVPEPKVTVNVPEIRVPDITMPDEMNVRGWVSLMGVDLNNPLPVQLRDSKGNPVSLFDNITQIVNGGGGGGPKIVKISDISNSAWASVLNADGRLRVETNDSGGSTQIVDQLSGANWSVNIATQPITLIVDQLSGSNWSVSVAGSELSTYTLTDSYPTPSPLAAAAAYNMAWDGNAGTWSRQAAIRHGMNVGNAGVAAAGMMIEFDDTSPATVTENQFSPWRGSSRREGYVQLRDAAGNERGANVDASGNLNVSVSGATATVGVIGDDVSDAVDTGGAPIKIGGIARQANPAAVAGGDRVSGSYDDVGRILTRPIQVRDLVATAYASVTNVTETVLLAAGASGVFHDLIFIKMSNQSSATVNVAIRSSTAGTIVDTFSIPANSTVGYAPPVPVLANESASSWTFQNTASDDSTTTITVSGLFTKEV